MTLKPGCGCAILVLGVANLALVLLAAYGLVSGTMGVAPFSIMMVLVFAANSVISFLVGVAAIRSRRRTTGGGGDMAGEAEADGFGSGDEGQES